MTSRTRLLLFGTSLGALLLAGGTLLQPEVPVPAAVSPPARSTSPVLPPPSAPSPRGAPAALTISQAIDAQERRMAFHLAYRNYLAQAADLDARERERQAGRLAEQIDAYEARDELALSEALLLQVALIRASGADAATQQKRADALSARYRGLSVARQAPQTSPQFERYKVEEQQIVAEVLGLTLLPPGLSRDQYLRQRLQAAREAAYAADPGNAR